MDLRFTAEEIAFRDEARAFFRERIPAEIRRKVSEGRHLSKDDMVAAHRIMHARGWAVPHWPKEWGGQDLSAVQRYILNEEMQRAAVPPPLPFNVAMVGPVIATFGNEAQKRRFLPPPPISTSGGAKDFRSRAPDRTSPACARAPSGRTGTTSSTARRRGRRWASTPTGCSRWCAPTARRRSRRASRSC